MLIAFIYDAFRIKRKTFKTSTIFIYMEDIAYWLIAVVVMFAVIYYSNEGEIRGYIFIGTVLGIILYSLLFSKIVTRVLLFIIKVVRESVKIIWRIVTYPVIIILRILAIPARFFYMIVSKTARRVKHIGKSRLNKISIWKRVFKNIRKKI